MVRHRATEASRRRGKGSRGDDGAANEGFLAADLMQFLESPQPTLQSSTTKVGRVAERTSTTEGKSIGVGRPVRGRKAGEGKRGDKPTRRRKTGVFFSYAREDSEHARQAEKALGVLTSSSQIDVHADWQLAAGERWPRRLKAFIRKSRIAILLLSNDFFNSAFIRDHELPAILERASHGRMTIVLLIVRHCAFDLHAELRDIQSVNVPDRPLASLANSDIEAELTMLARQVGALAAQSDTGKKKPRRDKRRGKGNAR